MSDYKPVSDALDKGADPSMLCATCPWDRTCVSPPTMTRAEIDAQMAKAAAEDEARIGGGGGGMPTGALLTALVMGGRDTAAQVCPVFALRLRSSGGRGIADALKDSMQKWDDLLPAGDAGKPAWTVRQQDSGQPDITIDCGPASLPALHAGTPEGHRVPHFDADGSCMCFCPGCSQVTARSPGVEESDCICAACPCRPAVTP